jgi:hypothetical protein
MDGSQTRLAMLTATCCGESTFAYNFTRLVAGNLYTPDKELNKAEFMRRALSNLPVPERYTALDTGLRRLAGVARAKNETLFFVAEAQPNFDHRHFGERSFSEMINNAFLTEALRLRAAVVIAHRNPLDLVLCSTNDCFYKDRAVMESTFQNGSYSPLCFARRSARERVYVRVHDFVALSAQLRELASMPGKTVHMLTAHKLGVDSPIAVVQVEDLAAFQYEETPGPLRALSISTWSVVLKGLGMEFTREVLQFQMDRIMSQSGVRQDELYSDRFWVPAREDDGLMEMRANVEALVDEFGFKRTPSSKLVDWTVNQTHLKPKQAARVLRYGSGVHGSGPDKTDRQLQHTRTSTNGAQTRHRH